MRYLKEFKLFESVNEAEIHALCREYDIQNYTINSDGSIDVKGSVDLSQWIYKKPNRGLTKLPLKFNKVGGGFYCNLPRIIPRDNKLTSLIGAPKEVHGGFYCANNQLTNLEGCPLRVGGDFYCNNNQIMNIDGLLWKSFRYMDIKYNPVFDIVGKWINSENREELIEYFIDLNVIQGDKVIMDRLRAFHEEMDVKMDIDLKEVRKNYTIIE